MGTGTMRRVAAIAATFALAAAGLAISAATSESSTAIRIKGPEGTVLASRQWRGPVQPDGFRTN